MEGDRAEQRTGVPLVGSLSIPLQGLDVKHADFLAALKVGKKEADQKMERSLYQRGVGYSYDAVKVFMPAGAKKPVIVPYVEHVPPDVTAGIFWMKNRDPAHWRDAWQVEHSLGSTSSATSR
jgi:hypothetical protein